MRDCCGEPFTNRQEMVLMSHDGVQHTHCLGCGQPFRHGQEIRAVKVMHTSGETTKSLPMHLECAVHACTAHGPLGN